MRRLDRETVGGTGDHFVDTKAFGETIRSGLVIWGLNGICAFFVFAEKLSWRSNTRQKTHGRSGAAVQAPGRQLRSIQAEVGLGGLV